jgi:hypothetical protein
MVRGLQKRNGPARAPSRSSFTKEVGRYFLFFLRVVFLFFAAGFLFFAFLFGAINPSALVWASPEAE